MSRFYGLTNRVINDVVSLFLSSQDLCKFLSSSELENTDIDSIEDLENTYDLYNKNIYINRRVPDLLEQEGAFISIRATRVGDDSTSNKPLDRGILEVHIVVSNNLLPTLNGSRDVCIMSIAKELLVNNNFSTVGKFTVIQADDLYGLPRGFSGYSIACEFIGYNKVLM